MTFAVEGLLLMIASAVVMAVKPFKTTPTHSNTACVYCWRHKQSNGYEELLGGGGEKLVSDRIENPEAYPKGNLSNFATLQKRQEARNINYEDRKGEINETNRNPTKFT